MALNSPPVMQPPVKFLVDVGAWTKDSVLHLSEPFYRHYYPSTWNEEFRTKEAISMGSPVCRLDPTNGPNDKRRRLVQNSPSGVELGLLGNPQEIELKMKNPSTMSRSIDNIIHQILVDAAGRKVDVIFLRLRIPERDQNERELKEEKGKPIRALSMLIRLADQMQQNFPGVHIGLDADLQPPQLSTISMLQMPVLSIESILYPLPHSLKFEQCCMDDARLPVDDETHLSGDGEHIPGTRKEARVNRWWKDVITSHFPDAVTRLAYSRCPPTNKPRFFVHLSWASTIDLLPPSPELAGRPINHRCTDTFSRSKTYRGVIHWMNPKDTRDHFADHLKWAVKQYEQSPEFDHMASLMNTVINNRRNDQNQVEFNRADVRVNIVPNSHFLSGGYDEHHYIKSLPSTMSIALEVRDQANNDPILFWSIEPTAHWRSFSELLFSSYCQKFPYQVCSTDMGEAGGWKSRGRFDSDVLRACEPFGVEELVRCIPPTIDYLETTRLVIMPDFQGMGLFPWLLEIWKNVLSYEPSGDRDVVRRAPSALLPIRIRTKSDAVSDSLRRHGQPSEQQMKRSAYQVFWTSYPIADVDGRSLWVFNQTRFESVIADSHQVMQQAVHQDG